MREKAKYRYKLQNDVNIYTIHSKHISIKNCCAIDYIQLELKKNCLLKVRANGYLYKYMHNANNAIIQAKTSTWMEEGYISLSASFFLY